MPLTTLVDQALRDLRRPTLVLSVEDALAALGEYDGVVLAELGDELPRRGGWGSVLLVAPDSAALRRAASVLPFLGRARAVVCVLRDRDTPLGLRHRPAWPPLRQVVARVGDDGGSVTRVELTAGVPVAEVLVELARQAAPGGPSGPHGVYVAQPLGAVPPPVDTTLVVAVDLDATVPPDVWLGDDDPPAADHPVLGRPVRRADGGIGPLDEGVLHPGGFRRDAAGPEVDLPAASEATEGLVRELHRHRGVRVPPAGRERLVAGLALAGVPLVAERLDDGTRRMLGEELAAAITTPVDLADAGARAEHARRLADAARERHATRAWRERLARPLE